MRLIDADALAERVNIPDEDLEIEALAVLDPTRREEFVKAAKAVRDGVLWDIAEAPTVDAEPVRHGYWYRDRFGLHHCSECDRAPIEPEAMCTATWEDTSALTEFCPHCGAKMDIVRLPFEPLEEMEGEVR